MRYAIASYVTYTVYNTNTGLPVTGDVSNHTCRLAKDNGSPTVCTNAPTEIGHGVYRILLIEAETECQTATLIVTSSTMSTHIPPVFLAFEDPDAYKADMATFSSIITSLSNYLGALPTASQIAHAVLDQTLSGHTATGTVGAALDGAASGISRMSSDISTLATSASQTAILTLLNLIFALVGKWSVSENTLTTYDPTTGAPLATYTLTRDDQERITSIT